MDKPWQLVMLPGLGADRRLLEPQRKAFGDLIVPPWIPPHRRETLPDYAVRLAQTIPKSRPLLLGGISLGGMVAYEMARHLRPDAVVLIASCRSCRCVRSLFLRLRMLSPYVPAWMIQTSKRFSRLGTAVIIGATAEQRRLCAAMYRDADSHFMRWAIGAILDWNPSPLEGIRILQIHGEKDRLIPVARVQADEVISGGGHFINLTEAERVNRFLERAVATAQT